VDVVLMQAIQRISAILKAVARQPEGISLAELSTEVSLAKSTTLRFLQSLELEGLIERRENTYRLGQGLIALVASVPHLRTLQAVAYPHLLELAKACNETVHLAVREGQLIRYIEQIDTPRQVQLGNWLNQAYPLHLTAAGKALLAYADSETIRNYLKTPLQSFTSKSLKEANALEQELKKIKARGYAETRQEFSDDINGFAVGLFYQQQIVASISISIPVFRFPKDGGKNVLGLLQKTVDNIHQHLQKEGRVDIAA
jgi:DNA-binding IclR family transcriptional regulator